MQLPRTKSFACILVSRHTPHRKHGRTSNCSRMLSERQNVSIRPGS